MRVRFLEVALDAEAGLVDVLGGDRERVAAAVRVEDTAVLDARLDVLALDADIEILDRRPDQARAGDDLVGVAERGAVGVAEGLVRYEGGELAAPWLTRVLVRLTAWRAPCENQISP